MRRGAPAGRDGDTSTTRSASLPKKPPPAPDIFRVGRSRTGLGLFAVEPIKRGQLIAEYWGKRIANKDADKLRTRYLFELNSRWSIDGADRRNLARYINHACRPNAKAYIERGAIRIYAVRRIEPGDEITYHYGARYFGTFIEPKGCRCHHCAQAAADDAEPRPAPRKTSRRA